jgi:hypothetical protein
MGEFDFSGIFLYRRDRSKTKGFEALDQRGA